MNNLIFFLLFCFCLGINNSIAQLANDDCASAQAVTIPQTGSICINSTNLGATSDLSQTLCDLGTPGNEVWYTYITSGGLNTINVTPNGSTPASNIVVSIQNQPCGSSTYNNCSSASGGATATTSFSYTPGTQIWICVETDGTDGTFELCVTNTVQPPAPGNTCATATTICTKNAFSLPAFPANSNVITPSCFPTPFQRPVFYQFTVGQSGTCIWSADPTGSAEYDWVMYDITGGCPGSTVCCNFNYASANGSPIGMSSGGAGPCGTNGGAGPTFEFSPPANVVIGNTYLIVIDNYSDNNVGFDFTWGGTFQMAPNPAFTVTPASGCPTLDVTINNISTASISYSWNFGNGNTSTLTNPTVQSYSTPGTYLISLVATSTSGCVNTTSQAVNVFAPATATISGGTSICSGSSATITFTGTPNATVNYTINNGPNLTIVLNASGSATVSTGNISANVTFDLVSAVLSGCTNPITGSETVSINPTPTVDAISNQTFCHNNTVPTTSINSTPTGATFSWTNSNTAIGLAASGSGSSIPTFVATNNSGSPITATITITPTLNGCVGPSYSYTITVNPSQTITASNNGPLCEGQTLNLTGTGSATAVYTWSGPNSFTFNGQNASIPLVAPINAGVYTLQSTLNGCTATITTTVVVNAKIYPSIVQVGPFCSDAAPVFLTSSIPGGTWSGTGITGTSSGEFTPSSANSGNNVITFTSSNTCSVPATTTIVVNTMPVVAFNSPILSGCAPFTAQFIDLSVPAGSSLFWDFGDGGGSNQTGNATHTFATPGCYDITLTATNNGCSSTLTQANYICVIPNAVASFSVGNSITTVLNTHITTSNTSQNATIYSWDFGDAGVSSATNPSHDYDDTPANYTIRLIANNSGNCPDTAYSNVQIKDELIYYVPNTFTPDGDEFNNDFTPIFHSGFDPQSYTMTIYDRWGEILFESHNVEIGWDGTYHGEQCKEGVYTWSLKFKETTSDKKFTDIGHVLILK